MSVSRMFVGEYVLALLRAPLQADCSNQLVRHIVISSGLVSTLAGTSGTSGSANGLGTAASFSSPTHAVMDAAGTFAIVVSCVWENVLDMCNLPICHGE